MCSVPGWAPAILGPHSCRGDAAVDVGCLQYPGRRSQCAPAPTPAQHMPWHCGLWRDPGYGHLSPRADGSCPGSGVGSRLAGLDISSLFNLAYTRQRPGDGHGKPASQLSQQPPAPAAWGSGTRGTPSPSCRPAPLGESLEKGDSCATLTQLPPLSRATWLSQGYVGPSPQEWHSQC